MKKLRILIACEESDEVRSRFEYLGFDAWSCDLQDNRNKKAKHIKGDLFNIINDDWCVVIAFPPCTHLCSSGAMWFKEKINDGRQQQAIDFFLKIANLNIKHIAIENPIGIMSNKYRKPDQIIQPYFFGDTYQKTTCLWLKNLPKLIHVKEHNLFGEKITHVSKGDFFYWIDKKTGKKKRQPMWYKNARNSNNIERSKTRSKTFPGIANAMAEQWGAFLLSKYK